MASIGFLIIFGAGKASAAMAHYVENILGKRITGGFIVTKYDYSCKFKYIKVTEAGHPVPDENSFRAAEELLKITGQAGPDDLVICLWFGGGSSLLADHPVTSSPVEISFLNEMPVCLLFGGETTVTVTGDGSGGRNQHPAISMPGFCAAPAL